MVKSGETVPRENLLDFTISDGQEWWNYTARKTCKNNVSPVSTVGAGENYLYWLPKSTVLLPVLPYMQTISELGGIAIERK